MDHSFVLARSKNIDFMIIESDLIWKTVKEIPGNEIPNKPLTYDSVDFGPISQKQIVQICKENFNAKKSNRHGEGRKLIFEPETLEQLAKTYDVPDEVKVLTEQDEDNGTHGTLVGLDRHINGNESGTHGTYGTLIQEDKQIDRHKDQLSLAVSDPDNIDNIDKNQEYDNKVISVTPKRPKRPKA